MPDVLNPRLYEQLLRRFGEVRITNPGQLNVFCDALRDGRPVRRVRWYGETYYVDCPYCGDRRKRLAINHQWATRDPESDDDFLHLAHCFHDECCATRQAQECLQFDVFGSHSLGRVTRVTPRSTACGAPPPIVLPPSEPLSSLREDHPAISYLRRRRFNPAKLERIWGVSYCASNSTSPPHFGARLLIPLYALPHTVFVDEIPGPPILAGWQARSIGSPSDWLETRYMTAAGTRKSALLYGLPQALAVPDRPLIVVEGVSDAWRVGRCAVALLGKTISDDQVRLILKHARGRPVVVLLDGDARDDADAVARKIQDARDDAGQDVPVRLGELPAGRKDPGECLHGEIRAAVEAALA